MVIARTMRLYAPEPTATPAPLEPPLRGSCLLVTSRAKLSVSASASITGMVPVQCARHFREVTYAVSYIHNVVPAVIHRDLSFCRIQRSRGMPLERACIR